MELLVFMACGLKGDGYGLKGEFFLLSCSIGFYVITMFNVLIYDIGSFKITRLINY